MINKIEKQKEKKKRYGYFIYRRLSSNFQIISVCNKNSHADNEAAEFIF